SVGDLLIGTYGGLDCLKAGTPAPCISGDRMKNTIFRCVYEDKRRVLWFGTDSGLIRLKDNKTVFYTVRDGLTEDYVYSVLEDNSGYLWLAGRNGISRIRKRQLEDFALGKITRIQPQQYNETHGMKSRWCTAPGYKTRDGRFWFATSAGVTTIHPDRIKTNSVKPPVTIEKFIVDDIALPVHAKGSGTIVKTLSPGR
ncbi:MAG: hypothetical protein GY940_41245, partial [bacterium]|nr:hypothetical protein [bacterium]